jgi:hypothetical protein
VAAIEEGQRTEKRQVSSEVGTSEIVRRLSAGRDRCATANRDAAAGGRASASGSARAFVNSDHPGGGATGMLVREHRGKIAEQADWKFAAALVTQINNVLNQAVIEGCSGTKWQLSGEASKPGVTLICRISSTATAIVPAHRTGNGSPPSTKGSYVRILFVEPNNPTTNSLSFRLTARRRGLAGNGQYCGKAVSLRLDGIPRRLAQLAQPGPFRGARLRVSAEGCAFG